MSCVTEWTHLLPHLEQLRIPLRTGFLRTLLCLSLAAAPLTVLNVAAAQSSGDKATSANDAPLPTVTESTTRAEILELIDKAQTQLEKLTADKPPGAKDSPKVTELRGQLEVLLMQSQLEQLQRENADLQSQLSKTAAQSGEADPAVIERQLEHLQARQNNMTEQMEVIAHQHSEILEYSDLGEYEAQTHKVEVGDTLSALAVEYYSNVMRWSEIAAANPSVTDPNLLTPGMSLTIPPKESEEDEESASTASN